MHRSTSLSRRACAIGTTVALVGLTAGFGVFSASAAFADPASPTTSATASADPTATADPTASADPTATADPTITPSPTATASDTPSPTSTPTPTGTPTPTASPTSAAAPTVTIKGDATPGNTVTVATKNFTGTSFTYVWSLDGTAVPGATGSSFDITPDMGGDTLSVVVTTTDASETATASVDITVPPVFVSPTTGAPLTTGLTADDPIQLTTTAGAAWSFTFKATGTPTPTLAPAFFSSDEEGDGDAPEDYFPDNTNFDTTSGVISGNPEFAGEDDFAVSATSAGKTVTEYVALTVTPAAPLGVDVYTANEKDVQSPTATGPEWIIEPDGSVYTLSADSSGDYQISKGGQPTVKQGGTLAVGGDVVDRYGNAIVDANGDSAPVTVSSNYASDVIGQDDNGNTTVTFPHASTHELSATSGAFTTSFSVVVVPTPATAVAATTSTTTPTAAGSGQLAYTGSDDAGLIPWALGLLGAGAAISALQVIRRRRMRG